MTYALGRTVEAEDMPTVRQVVRDAANENYRFSALVMNIINSDLFRMNSASELSSISEGDSVAMNSETN